MAVYAQVLRLLPPTCGGSRRGIPQARPPRLDGPAPGGRLAKYRTNTEIIEPPCPTSTFPPTSPSASASRAPRRWLPPRLSGVSRRAPAPTPTECTAPSSPSAPARPRACARSWAPTSSPTMRRRSPSRRTSAGGQRCAGRSRGSIGKADRRTGKQADRRTGGQADRRKRCSPHHRSAVRTFRLSAFPPVRLSAFLALDRDGLILLSRDPAFLERVLRLSGPRDLYAELVPSKARHYVLAEARRLELPSAVHNA